MEVTQDRLQQLLRKAFLEGAHEGQERTAQCLEQGWSDLDDYLYAAPLSELEYYDHRADFTIDTLIKEVR